jgi:adenosylmethionine---8-amino-7-oxononanoate aminotransferase
LRAGMDAGMGKLVHQHQPVAPNQYGDDAGIGQIAGAEDDGRLGLLDAGEASLQRGIKRVIAGDKARGTGPGAVFLNRRDGCVFNRRMVAEVEIVVAGKRQQPSAVALDPDAVLAQRLGEHAAQMPALESIEFFLREAVEGVHQGDFSASLSKMPALQGAWKRPMAGDSSGRSEGPDWYAEGLGHVWLPYAQMKTVAPPLPVVGTQGARIRLADGRELVDGIASWWTACHGYNHPHIRQAVERQLAQMPHVMFGGLVHEQALRLARRLAALLPGDLSYVFFSDSGSVAVEVALKMAQQYWWNLGIGGRSRFLAFKGGYHGDTTGAMAVSDTEDGMHALFAPVLPQHVIVDLPDSEDDFMELDKMLAEKAETITGIIVEPLVQGAGGMRFHDATTLKRLRDLAEKYDLLLIFDEIFTGFGRTGTLFACEQAGVVPDIITLSKALTGGTLPLAATIATGKVFDAFWSDDPAKALMHGPTYMANGLACAAANASLDLFEREPRLQQVAEIKKALEQGLAPCRDFAGVTDVRVKGAIGVVELAHIADLDALRARFIAEGVFIRPIGNVIYLTPAFTIAADELQILTDAVVRVVRSLNA